MQDFRRLRVWQKAHEQAVAIYVVTKRLPSEERYGLTSQMRRSAASVAANIAEGCGRRGLQNVNVDAMLLPLAVEPRNALIELRKSVR